MERWPQLSDDQRLAWLRLIRTPRVGPSTFRDLVNHFGSASAALEALPEMSTGVTAALRPFSEEKALQELEHARSIGAFFVAPGETGYPLLLAKLDRPPPLLCAAFATPPSPALTQKPTVAIVGSRNASAGGLSIAKTWGCALSEAGFCVVSGLARGTDAAAHHGAIKGGTVAFHAGGLAKPYPPEHANLMRSMVDHGGAVYSEMPISWTARSQDFPRRNRLVAGASYGVVIVEAAARSGSLITANQALDLGRLVMAVPGFPLDPRSEGPNSLIKDGATPVTSADDVIDEIRPLLADHNSIADETRSPPKDTERDEGFRETAPAALENTRQPYKPKTAQSPIEPEQGLNATLTRIMATTAVSADTLVRASGASASEVRAWLLTNELSGRIDRKPGDRFAWASDVTSP